MRRSIKRATVLVLTLLLALLPLSAAAAPVGGGQASPSNSIKAYGCDISFWNVGGYYPDYSRVNFEKMKADGCDFVILRVGFEGTDTRQDTIDDAFLTLYAQAKEAGLGVGAYFYALATTYEGAAADAAWCIDLFEQYNLSFEYPIYYDVEDPGNDADRLGHDALNSDEMTQLCLGWAQTLEAAGYFPGVYSDYETIIKLKPSYTKVYDVWYAYVAYNPGVPEFIPEEQDHSAFSGMWQYSWKGSFDGVVGDLDVNVAYKDYPGIMKTNGYNNMPLAWASSLSVMPRHNGLSLNAYNENGEGIAPTYHADGAVTFKNTVSTASWSWPSAYMVYRGQVDLKRHPLLTIEKSGTAHFNATLLYVSEDGKTYSLNLATAAKEHSGEFAEGDMTITVDVREALRQANRLPDNGVLEVVGVTYFIMGAKNTYVTLQSATFTEAPFPGWLDSDHFAIDDLFVSGVKASMTARELFLGFHNANGAVVRDANGAMLKEDDRIASGMTVAIEKDGKVVKSYTLSLLGDVNGDGEATTIDARMTMLSSLSTAYVLSDWQKHSADYNRNGEIATADVRDILLAALVTKPQVAML